MYNVRGKSLAGLNVCFVYLVSKSILMNAEEMKDRTKGFAISIARLAETIQDSTINKPYK